jgi:hypothetical protein
MKLPFLPLPQELAEEHDEGIDNQEHGGGLRASKELTNRIFENDAEQADRHSADDEQPSKSLVRIRANLTANDALNERPHDSNPRIPVENHERERRAQMQYGDKSEKRWIGTVDIVPLQHCGDEDGLAEAAYREQFAYAL